MSTSWPPPRTTIAILAPRICRSAAASLESDTRSARWYDHREDWKFTGKEEDMEVGLTYFGARYYASHLGRWASPDPLTVHALGSDLNPYAYVRGRVMTHIDPFGLDACIAGGAAGSCDLPDGTGMDYDRATNTYTIVEPGTGKRAINLPLYRYV